MESLVEVFYFGDQSVEPFESIEELANESKNSRLLTEYLQTTFEALTLEVSKLTRTERSLFQACGFMELASFARKQQRRHVAISTVLSCVAQLGWTVV